MSITKGDRVQLIFTGQIGIVRGFHDGDLAIVEVDGDKIPVYTAHLEKMSGNAKHTDPHTKLLNKKQQTADTLKNIGLHAELHNAPDNGIQLILQPFWSADGDIEYFLVHLSNDSGKSMLFDYTLRLNGLEHYNLNKNIGGRETMVLNSIDFDQLNDSPWLEIIFKHHKKFPKLEAKFKKMIKPRAKMLRKPPIEVTKINGKGYVFDLFKQLPIKKPDLRQTAKTNVKQLNLQELKIRMYEKRLAEEQGKPEVFINAAQRIVDLHIEKLMPSHKHLRNSEMLAFQLRHFEKQVAEAIERKEKNMIVIHGLGRGKLKQEIFKRMGLYPEIVSSKNEYDARFGFGATEIYFEYEKKE